MNKNWISIWGNAVSIAENRPEGYGKNITVLDLANIIGGEMVFEPERKEAKHSLADITKTKRLLGWEPKVAIEEGLKDLMKFFGL